MQKTVISSSRRGAKTTSVDIKDCTRVVVVIPLDESFLKDVIRVDIEAIFEIFYHSLDVEEEKIKIVKKKKLKD